MAAGYEVNGATKPTLIESWDGSTWSVSPSPTLGGGGDDLSKTCKPSMKAPCLLSLVESSGSAVATFLSPATDPRFWTGEAAADLSKLSPTKAPPGATVTISGKNLTGIIAVVIGGGLC
jgi:hypothetical protein